MASEESLSPGRLVSVPMLEVCSCFLVHPQLDYGWLFQDEHLSSKFPIFTTYNPSFALSRGLFEPAEIFSRRQAVI